MIPNIKNIFLKSQKKDEGQNIQNGEVMSTLLNILVDKLKNNLKKMPSIYSYGSSLSNQFAVSQGNQSQ